MRYKIAVVTTEYIRRHIEWCLSKLKLEATFCVCCYHPFEDIEPVYATIPTDAVGILTTGKIFAEAIQHDHPEDARELRPFGVDDAAVHRLLWRLWEEEGPLDFSRVYTDFLDLLHMDTREFLVEDHEMTLSDAMTSEARNYITYGLQSSEQQQYQKLISIWKTGQFDQVLTRYSELIPLLREKGVRAYYPYPSIDSVRRACVDLLHHLEIRTLQEHQAAEIHVNLWIANPIYTVEDLFERRCSALQSALNDFFSRTPMEYLIQRSHFGLDILTDRKTIAYCTQGYTACLLEQFLRQRLDFKVFIGYGMGSSIYQARLNAINATRESEVSGGSYLINERDELIGPLGDGQLTVPTTAALALHANRSGLSSLTVSKVMAALDSMSEQQISAGELAAKLGITRRSANHFLSAMKDAGLLQITAERRTTTRGRPERIYSRPR
ncbi:MAG: hypothetical protein HFE97_03675 [Oscillospiraceae bacterium]|nr:hypothetical protein [Oscillospiraceae bacterium]